MTKKLITFLLVLSFQSIFSINWLTNYEDAQKLSLATNKFILVEFTAYGYSSSEMIAQDIWSDKELNEFSENFVMLKIDVHYNKDIASKFSKKDVDSIFIIDANGKEILNFISYKDLSSLKNKIADYMLSTEFIASDLINFFKLNNYSNGVRIASKYFDFGLNVDKKIKNQFLGVASDYIDAAKKLIDKKDPSYVEKTQKLELIKLYKFAYNFEFDKLDKKLTKEFMENTIAENNKSQYYFLKAIVLLHQSNGTYANTDNNEIFNASLNKAKLVFELSKA